MTGFQIYVGVHSAVNWEALYTEGRPGRSMENHGWADEMARRRSSTHRRARRVRYSIFLWTSIGCPVCSQKICNSNYLSLLMRCKRETPQLTPRRQEHMYPMQLQLFSSSLAAHLTDQQSVICLAIGKRFWSMMDQLEASPAKRLPKSTLWRLQRPD
uniref:Uncharacterized protein n=1 Tax=Setaria viridis TaxID=4556 RepID=A0A4U6STL2_SETVI|nr:hypothetical protein SEVIR_9G133250v2 [Setaria viridis]